MKNRNLVRDAMIFAVKDITGRVLRESAVQSMIDDFEKQLTAPGVVVKRFLIYADNDITWNEKKDNWNHSDEFTGTYLDAHKYARLKYGKRYTLYASQCQVTHEPTPSDSDRC